MPRFIRTTRRFPVKLVNMAEPIPNVEADPVSPAAPATASAFTLREIAVFGSTVSAVLLSANAFTCATWSHFFGLPGWIAWQILPGLLAFAFVPATILRFRSSHPALRVLYALSAAWVGALNLLFSAAIACWILEGLGWLAGWSFSYFYPASILFGLAFLATGYGLINASWIRIKRITIPLPHLPMAWQGRTVALVTDLHLGPLSGPGFLRRVIERLRSFQPDAVFISGDMFDGPVIGLDQLVTPWRDFSPPRGIFYVTGNHDEFAERSIYLKAVSGSGIQVLNNAMFSVDGLQVVGVHDSEAANPAEFREILHQVHIDRRHPSILLAHRPVNLSVAEEAGISLQLSGHTHGGQFWPWTMLVSRIYGGFAYGIHRLGSMAVYTSSGAGTWGPPLRVGTQSEIVLIRLEADSG